MLTLLSHGHVEAGDALKTLAITVLGAVCAVFAADILSHIVVQERMMTKNELKHAAAASFGALGAVSLPVLFLLISL